MYQRGGGRQRQPVNTALCGRIICRKYNCPYATDGWRQMIVNSPTLVTEVVAAITAEQPSPFGSLTSSSVEPSPKRARVLSQEKTGTSMDLSQAKIFAFVAVFVILILFIILPFILVRFCFKKKNLRANSKKRCNFPWFNLSNCLAAGIFMATCFIGLLPHIRHHVGIYESMFEHDGAKRHVPWAEFLVIVGFLSVLMLEEAGRKICCRSKKATKHKDFTAVKEREKEDSETKNSGLNSMEEEPLMDVEFVAVEDDSQDSREESFLRKDLHSKHNHNQSHNNLPNHHHHHHNISQIISAEDDQSLNWRSAALLLSLGIHGVFEGVALGLQDTPDAFWKLLGGVMTHEILCALAFGVNLAATKMTVKSAFLSALLLAFTVPGGMLSGLFFHADSQGSYSHKSLLVKIILEGFAAGTFVHVAFFHMLKEELAEQNDNYRFLKILCIFCGFLLFFFITLWT
uniref:Zinc transporter ZIP3 n=1 Tax=Romanomermis culicivorax TaxID=13658 RepID=A0A915IVM0_ROMCU